jgi:UDP-N-acetylmuramoylalanine--D-glutamate ligase
VGFTTPLPGLHNRENIAAAAALAQVLQLDSTLVKQVIADFKGVPSRQETIAVVGGVTYINDTTSTTPVAAIRALQAAAAPTIWITGGDTKNLPYEELVGEVKNNPKLKKIVILGSQNIPDYIAKLQEVVGDKIVGTATGMQEAVKLASSSSIPGDSVCYHRLCLI